MAINNIDDDTNVHKVWVFISKSLCMDILHMSLCLIASVTSLVSSGMFLNKVTFKDPTYRLLLAECLGDFLYSSLTACTIILFRMYGFSWPMQVYFYVVYDYLLSCLAIDTILIELYLSVQRLFILLNRAYCLKSFPSVLVVLVVHLTGLVYYVPCLFLETVVQINISNESSSSTLLLSFNKSSFATTPLGSLVMPVLSLVRLALSTLVMFPINLITLYEFKKLIARKANLKSNNLSVIKSCTKHSVVNF
jgi:hypothetical protein